MKEALSGHGFHLRDQQPVGKLSTPALGPSWSPGSLETTAPMKRTLASVLVALGLAAIQSSASTVTIKYDSTAQTIEGFGAGSVYYQNWITAHPAKKEIYDTVFTGLGLSYLRVGNWLQNLSDSSKQVPIDSEIVAEAKARLGSRMRILMSSWSAPGGMKVLGTTKNPGKLSPKNNTLVKENGAYVYGKFASWWKASLERYAQAGIVPDDISIQNEPDMNAEYEGTMFAPTELTGAGDTLAGYAQALVAVHDTLAKMAKPPRIIAPEVLGIGYGNFPNWAGKLNAAKFGAYAYHLYHGNTNDKKYEDPDGFNYRFSVIKNQYGAKPNIMSEFCPMRNPKESDMITEARVIQNALVFANAAGYITWELLWKENGQMVGVENPWQSGSWTSTTGWFVHGEYHGMRHYSKFVPPGWKRVAAAADDTTKIRVSAFRNVAGDSLVAVVLNISADAQTLTLSSGAFAGKGEVWQSVMSGDMSRKLASDGTGSIALPDSSVSTIVLASKSTSVQRGLAAAFFGVRASGRDLVVDGVTGPVRLLDASGRETARVDAKGEARFEVPRAGVWIVEAGASGMRTVAVP